MFGGRIRSCVLVLNLIAAAACAHGGASGASRTDAADNSVYVAPKVMGAPPVMRLRTQSARFRGTIEIPISADGRADVFGLRSTQVIDPLMKTDLQDWLQQVSFIPAKRDGVPVAGVFKMTFR